MSVISPFHLSACHKNYSEGSTHLFRFKKKKKGTTKSLLYFKMDEHRQMEDGWENGKLGIFLLFDSKPTFSVPNTNYEIGFVNGKHIFP